MYIRIHSIRKTVGEKYPGDLLPARSVHSLDTLLSHQAMGKNLLMAAKRHNRRRRSHDSDNRVDVVYIKISFIQHNSHHVEHILKWSQSKSQNKCSA